MNPQNPGMGLGPHAGLGAVVNENWSVPDKMVGLSEYHRCPFMAYRNYTEQAWYSQTLVCCLLQLSAKVVSK